MSPESPDTRASLRFDIIDALTVVGPWRDRPPGTAYEFEDLLEEHARLGIGRRLTLHAEARDGVPDEGNHTLTRMTFLREDTGAIWTALPSRRFGAPTVDSFIKDASAAGVAMFALFPETHGHYLASWANRDLYLAMERFRVPLALDMGNAQGIEARRRYEDIHALATAHPKLPIVVWNSFYMDERLHVPLLDACPNVHIGIATVFIPTWGIEQYTARYGPGRLIYGSNWPRQSPGPLLTYILYADIAPRAKIDILGGNIARLIGGVRWNVRGFKKPDLPTAPLDAETAGAPETDGRTREPEPDEQDQADEEAAPWLKALADIKAGITDPDE